MNRCLLHQFDALGSSMAFVSYRKSVDGADNKRLDGIFEMSKMHARGASETLNRSVSLPRNTNKNENNAFFDRTVQRQTSGNRLFGKKSEGSRKKEFGEETWRLLTLKEVI